MEKLVCVPVISKHVFGRLNCYAVQSYSFHTNLVMLFETRLLGVAAVAATAAVAPRVVVAAPGIAVVNPVPLVVMLPAVLLSALRN